MDYNTINTSFQYQPNFSQIILFMKQKLFGAASLVAFILFGASCSQQEQSEFNMDSVKQEVTISAKITYDAGVEADASNPNGYKIVNAKPAVGRKVFVEIPFAKYSAAAAAGNKIFETVTDENGVFTITVPTKSTGVNASIRLEEFTAVYQEYVKMGDDGKPVFKSKLYSYDTPAGLTNINLKPGAFKFPDNNDISYVMHALDMEDFDETVTIAGSINLAYETGFREGAFKSASNANVEFEIAYVGMTNPLTFGTTTDANGNYKITLPMRTLSEGFTINSIKVLGIGDNEFKHWVSDTVSQPQIIKGAYELAGITAGAPIVFSDVIDGITYDLGAKNLIFTPYYNAGITNIPEPENWSKDLIGWSAGRGDLGFNETFDKTAKLTGKVYMPYLKAYGEGAYKNEKQTIILTGTVAPYDKGLVVITDQDGSFSVDLPVKDETPITFTVKLEKEDQPFEFKGSNKNVTLYDGKYNSNTKIKEEGTEWYELGDFYFKYAPDGSNTPDEWNEYLIGWYRSAEFKQPVQVKGNIMFSVETSYGIGEYQPQIRLVEVTTDDTPARKFAIKTKANGAFDFMIPLKDEHDQPTLSVTSTEYKTNEYVHYPKYNDDATQLLDVKYTKKATAYLNKEDKAAWNNLGTTYMYVKATDVNHKPDTFNEDLAGWFIKTTDDDVLYQQSIKASGKAYMAVETDYLTGEYKAAKGQLVKLSVYSTNVSVLANNSGTFQFNVPIKNVGDETTLNVSATSIDVEDFKHFVDPTGKYNIIEGKYTGEKIKSSDAQWNDLGTVYYTFKPKGYTPGSADPFFKQWEDYFQHIAGWVYVDGRFVREANVTGTVRIAEESGFRVGIFEAAKKFPVKIQVGSTYYVAATDAEGTFSIPVWQKFSGDEETVNWDNADITTDELGQKFKHYRKVGTETVEYLEGTYKVGSTLEKSGAAWNDKGTRYYIVKSLTDATEFTNDLAGWEIWSLDAKTTLTIKGFVHQAYEKKDGLTYVPGWEASPNRLISVTVGTIGTFKTSTSSSGAFSFTVKTTASEAPADIAISVSLDKEIKSTSFTHYTDPSSAASKISLSGKYQYASNISSNISKTGNNIYEVKEPSFKLIFVPDGSYKTDPEWTQYDWSSKYDVDK